MPFAFQSPPGIGSAVRAAVTDVFGIVVDRRGAGTIRVEGFGRVFALGDIESSHS